jgi:voltage-gated potassium channel Kch
MIANENQKNARIVILAEKDKVEMELEIRDRVKVRGSTQIICRSGDPVDVNDLEIVNPQTAKSIIILPPDDDNDPDTAVIKTVLAITNNLNRRAEPYHIVTQLRNETNLNLVQLAGERDNVQAVLSGDLIARVVAQTSRQSGLSIVYTELMNFGGDEIYLQHEPSLAGKTYGESLNLFEDSSLIGLKKADGTILVSPSMDTLIEKDDRIIALSEDDDTIHLSNLKLIPISEQSLRSSHKPVKPETEKCLIVGWNRSGAIIVRELDNYVPKGSLLTIFSDTYAVDKQLKRQGVKLKNQKLTVVEGDTTDRELLNKLSVKEYDHVIVLANGGLDHKEADAKTLVTLLHLRHMAGQDETPFSIVSEMLDIRNRELAEVTQVDDFIVSDHLISLMLSQLSEDADLFDVFKDIFDPEGVEIYLKPISDYVETGTEVNFYTVVEAARRRGETAIGYRLDAESKDAGRSYGVHTNPLKSTSVTYSAEDKVIVIAEE